MLINKLKAATAAFAMLAATPALAEMTLSYTDQSPPRGVRAEATIWLFDEIEKRTNGELKVEPHWGGALMKAKDTIKGVGDGAADMGVVIGIYNPSLSPALVVGDLPTEYSEPWVGSRAMYDLAINDPQMKAEFDKLNVHFITHVTTGPIQLVCRERVIKSLDEINGLKFRGISVYGKIFEGLGAQSVTMPVYEVYQALDSGLIDCTHDYGYAIRSMKHDEVANVAIRLDWGALMGVAIFMNKDVYEALPAEQQKVIDEVGYDYVDHFTAQLSDYEDNVFKEIAEGAGGNDMKVYEFPAGEKAKLLEAGFAYVDEWKARVADLGVDGDALYDAYLAALKKYDAEFKTNGYPAVE